MAHRFYCPDLTETRLAVGEELQLPAEVAHHAERVLRLSVNAPVVLFDGRGQCWQGVLIETGRRSRVRLTAQDTTEHESPLAITLVQALAVADKMDWVVQKAVELGVTSFQPVAAERSVLRLDGERAEKRVAHWRQVAVSAAEQCGRNILMPVNNVRRLHDYLATPAEGERWILSPDDASPLAAQARPLTPISLFIGPEGGWSPSEMASLKAAGCKALSLGPRILRTETAGLAAVAAMQALWGDF